MFDETVCLTEGCTDPCTDGQRFCCRCLSENERERLHTGVIEELHASSVWENRNFSLMSFRNEDFSEKLIFASSFYGVIFENCRFDRSRFFACFFEKAVFINCSFKETESKYNIVGNSTIQNTSFAGSDILFSNFIGALIENTDFSDAIPELRRSQAAFERWCDDKIIREIRPQLWNSFGLGPIAAYIIARETEIRSVRILLAAKQNGFPEDMIRERIRETYV